MLKIIYISILTTLFSCGNANEKKEGSTINTVDIEKTIVVEKSKELDDKEQPIKAFFNLFDNNFVSMKDFEDIFGSYLVEEEELFFQDCENNNNIDYCNKAFDDCLKDISKCQSKVFSKIKELTIIKNVLPKQSRQLILQNIKKIDDFNYESVLKDSVYKFNFTNSETGKIIINRFSVNNTSIFKDLFN